jgi:hypothetical protein
MRQINHEDFRTHNIFCILLSQLLVEASKNWSEQFNIFNAFYIGNFTFDTHGTNWYNCINHQFSWIVYNLVNPAVKRINKRWFIVCW